MFQIAFCDSDEENKKIFVKTLSDSLFKKVEFEFVYFDGIEDLIESARNHSLSGVSFNLVFFDFQNINIEFSKAVESINNFFPEANVVVAGMTLYSVPEKFRLAGFEFVSKPISPTRLRVVAGHCLGQYKLASTKVLAVDVGRSQKDLHLHRIAYFQRSDRKITAYMNMDETFGFYDNLDRLERLLANFGFVRCHQSYLVNRDYIKTFDGKKLHLVNGTEIPASRTYINEIRRILG